MVRDTSDEGSATRLDPTSPSRRADDSSDVDDGGFTPGTLLLARYRIVGLIGRGGMGEVYRAQDLKLGQAVALKFLPEAMQRDASRLERFLHEVRTARQISHPNVCRVYDVGEIDGRHFLSMEFVDGEDLASLLRRIGRLPADKGVEIARQLCAGLAAAHDRGVLHRDLKPANIMIDGRGHARLADFGLAAAGEELRAGTEVAGTPAYMAPEQLEGHELSTRSDIYALGLVLHEIFTGKRVFQSMSLGELRDEHRRHASSRSRLSSSVVDLDPAVDRVIRRCLEPDPRQRPASALAVAAALPGGDPLAAALAAGETPSPELLAESGAAGGLAPAVAWALLTALVVGVVATAWLADRVRLYRLVPGMRSPEVLAARAEDLLDSIGYGRRADRGYGWRMNRGVTEFVRQHDQQTDRWERLARADAPVVYFWYRQSPQALVPYDYAGGIDPDDPPLVSSEMANVMLSSRGRLVSLRAVPPRYEEGPDGTTSTDWSPLFKAAGIDESALKSIEPRWTPSTYADHRAAWEGVYPGRPDWTMRVEAASYRSRPVWFEVFGPWQPSRPSDETQAASFDPFTVARRTVQVGIGIVALVFGTWLARRNIRAGRADRRGAALVGIVTGVPMVVAWLVGNHHAGGPDAAWSRFTTHLALALYWSVVVWLVYLALEPFVRRRWPEAMISWTRLLAGRFGDSLVARDILIGCVGGAAIIFAGDITKALPEWLGEPPISPTSGGNALRSLGLLGAFIAELVLRPTRVLMESFQILFLILLSHIVVRNRWAANAVVAVIFGAVALNREAVLFSALFAVIFVAVVVFLISRFGVLAYVAAMFVHYAVNDLPLSLDMSSWYAARSAIVGGLIVAVAAWGFYRSLAGRSPFGMAFE